MVILDQLETINYIMLGVDGVLIVAFFYVVLKNVGTVRLTGVFKSVLLITVLWGLSEAFGLQMSSQVFGVVISYMFLGIIIVFPEEFHRMLTRFGRKDIVRWNKYRLISRESIEELSKAVMVLSRRREGAMFVIARKSDMQDEIDQGEQVGDMKIKANLIQEILKDGSYYSKGAVIIRDNEIRSLNVMLDMINYPELVRKGAGERHLGAFWVTSERDSIAVVVSGTTGKVSISSMEKGQLEYLHAMETRETNVTSGLDEPSLSNEIERRLIGKEVKNKEDKNKGKKKDKKQNKRKLSKQEKKAEKAKKNEPKKVSRGFGNK